MPRYKISNLALADNKVGHFYQTGHLYPTLRYEIFIDGKN